MIERFNFYDIYGYLLPGLLLFVLLWVPIGVLADTWPPAALSSALLALALAYVAGHLLDNLSSAAFPSLFRDKQGRKRQPSDLLFDKSEDEVLSQRLWDLKQPIAEQIKDQFKIDVQAGADWTIPMKGTRSAAFLKCRSVLVKAKAAAYAEQQQGMYVLMRGSAGALVLACSWYTGLAVGAWASNFVWKCPIEKLGLFASLIAAFISALLALKWQTNPSRDERKPRAFVLWLMALALAFGGLAAGRHLNVVNFSAPELPAQLARLMKEEKDAVKFQGSERALAELRVSRAIRAHVTALMFGLASAAALLTPLCLSAYRAFAVNFAVTVYRDYYRSAAADRPRIDYASPQAPSGVRKKLSRLQAKLKAIFYN